MFFCCSYPSSLALSRAQVVAVVAAQAAVDSNLLEVEALSAQVSRQPGIMSSNVPGSSTGGNLSFQEKKYRLLKEAEDLLSESDV